jgi:hypothetical protein
VTVEVLYVDGCPNVTATVDRVRIVCADIGVHDPITLISVSDYDSAQAHRFLGSPTVRINGIDIEPSAQSRSDYGLMCRTYPGIGGVPSEEMIRNVLAALLPSVG